MPQPQIITTILTHENQEASLEQTQDLHVLGHFSGELNTEGDLFIEASGSFCGEAHVANAYIRGSFSGKLQAQQIFLFDRASFKGTLDCFKANITLGASCCGEVRIISRED